MNTPALWNKERLAWIALLLVSVVMRLWGLGERGMSHDESLHVYFSHYFVTTGGYTHDPMMHGPFLFHITAAMFKLFGASDFTARLAPALLGVGSVALLWRFRPWLGAAGAFAAALLLAFSPSFLFYGRYIRNDVFSIFFALAWILFAFSYLETRRPSRLALMALAMGFSFAVKEVAFIYGAIFGLFFLTLGLVRRRTRENGALPALDLAFTMLFLVLPFACPVIHLALGWDPLEDKNAQGIQRTAGLILAAMGLALALGWVRFHGLRHPASLRRGAFFSFAAAALIFWSVSAVLFSTMGGNPKGLLSGFAGSMGYWLAQQDVGRGDQPWFYYFILTPMYEFLPLLLGVFALAFRSIRSLFHVFVLWWALAAFIGFTLAGEKMPWLTVHIAAPLTLLSGIWLQDILKKYRHRTIALTLGGVFLLALFALSLFNTLRLCYVNEEHPVEPMVYAHAAPGVKQGLALVEEAAQRTGKPSDKVSVYYDEGTAWPMCWYLRDYAYRSLKDNKLGDDAKKADALVLGPDSDVLAPELEALGYTRHRFTLMWWPLQEYSKAQWNWLPRLFRDPEFRTKALDALLWREYAWINRKQWPLRRDYSVYIKLPKPGSP